MKERDRVKHSKNNLRGKNNNKGLPLRKGDDLIQGLEHATISRVCKNNNNGKRLFINSSY